MNNYMNVTQNNVKPQGTKSTNKTENGTKIVMPGETDKDLFLKLLVAQMGNQDPMNPQDPTQYVTQLAQFSSLEQMQGINKSMEYLVGLTDGVLVNSAMSTASSMIGKHVEVYEPEENKTTDEVDKTKENEEVKDKKKTLTGVVEGIKIENNVIYMDVRLDETGELKSIEYGSLIKVSEHK